MRSLAKVLLGAVTAAVVAAPQTRAANLASDSAANPTYGSGWFSGQNGGTGFGPWVFHDNVPGSTVWGTGNSSSNGVPNSSGDINTPQNPSGRAWSIASTNYGFAHRELTGGALSPGQTFTIDMDNGEIATPDGALGLELTDVADTHNLFNFGAARRGLTDYDYGDNSGSGKDSGIPLTDRGLHLAFTLTSDTTYSAAITPVGSPTRVIMGELANLSGDHAIGNVDLVAYLTGTNASDVGYFNNMAVTPEPGALSLLGLLLPGLLPRPARTRPRVRVFGE